MPSKQKKSENTTYNSSIKYFMDRARCGDDNYVIAELDNITSYGVLFAATFSDNLSESTKDMIRTRMNILSPN